MLKYYKQCRVWCSDFRSREGALCHYAAKARAMSGRRTRSRESRTLCLVSIFAAIRTEGLIFRPCHLWDRKIMWHSPIDSNANTPRIIWNYNRSMGPPHCIWITLRCCDRPMVIMLTHEERGGILSGRFGPLRCSVLIRNGYWSAIDRRAPSYCGINDT